MRDTRIVRRLLVIGGLLVAVATTPTSAQTGAAGNFGAGVGSGTGGSFGGSAGAGTGDAGLDGSATGSMSPGAAPGANPGNTDPASGSKSDTQGPKGDASLSGKGHARETLPEGQPAPDQSPPQDEATGGSLIEEEEEAE